MTRQKLNRVLTSINVKVVCIAFDVDPICCPLHNKPTEVNLRIIGLSVPISRIARGSYFVKNRPSFHFRGVSLKCLREIVIYCLAISVRFRLMTES